MKNILLFSFAVLIGNSLHAQVPDLKKTTQDVSGLASPGNLLSQFAGAIKPTSFLDNWSGQQSSWLGNAGKITSAIGMAQSLSSLIGFLKPGAFKTGFNVQNLLQTAGKVKTMSSAAGLMKSLEGGLKPESLSDGWATQKTGWLSALNLLK